MVNERCVSEAKKQKKRELCIYSLRWQTGLHQPHEREAYVYDINSCDQTHDVGGGVDSGILSLNSFTLC